MTARKAAAQPVANLAESRKAQAAMRQAEAGAKQRHPAGKAQPKPAAKKSAPTKAAKPAAEQVKVMYEAVGRGGVRRTATSTSVLTCALDAKISGRRGAHFSQGAIIQFYASREKAEAAAAKIREAGGDWSDPVIVAATPVEAVSA